MNEAVTKPQPRSTKKLAILATLVLMIAIVLVLKTGSFMALSALMVLGSFIKSFIIFPIVAIIIGIIFVCWNWRLFSEDQANISLRSILLYLLTLVGSSYWHVKYLPPAMLSTTIHWKLPLVLSALAAILTTGVFISGLTKPRFITNLGFNLLLFIWLFYCAFPWYFGMI